MVRAVICIKNGSKGCGKTSLGGLDCDLIIISYGPNDAISPTINTKLYKQNFTFIRTLRKLQPKASILLTRCAASALEAKKRQLCPKQKL